MTLIEELFETIKTHRMEWEPQRLVGIIRVLGGINFIEESGDEFLGNGAFCWLLLNDMEERGFFTLLCKMWAAEKPGDDPDETVFICSLTINSSVGGTHEYHAKTRSEAIIRAWIASWWTKS